MEITKETLMKLQNGSDIRGVAIDGVAGEPVSLTPEIVNRLSGAFTRWLSSRTGRAISELKIGVGHDSRLSASALKSQVLQAVTALGATAFDCGLSSTPAMFMSIVMPETKYDGALMITASHLPYNRNGIKFFDTNGGLEHGDITSLLEIASMRNACTNVDTSGVSKVDLLSLYSNSLCKKIRLGVNNAPDYDHPLKDLHVVVDAGNGAGGFFAEKVLTLLGADTTGSQFLDPDGTFPNHIPNPEEKSAMQSIKKAVLDSHADLGIIFDTDVDRMSAVLSNGEEINRDAIIAMISAILAKDYPGSVIVTDSVTSDRLTTFLENTLGLKHHRFKRGYKNVINECKRFNANGQISPLAMETSGHGALSENYYLDDGAYLAVKLLIAAANLKSEGKTLSSLISDLPTLCESCEYRMRIAGEDFGAYGAQVLRSFEVRARDSGYKVAPNSYEGVRVSFHSDEICGWALLRVSLHDPLMPLNVEGERPGDCARITNAVAKLLSDFDKLDFSALGYK